MYVCMYVCIYIYIYDTERERERERERESRNAFGGTAALGTIHAANVIICLGK